MNASHDTFQIAQDFVVSKAKEKHSHAFQGLLAMTISLKASLMAMPVYLNSEFMGRAVEIYNIVADRSLTKETYVKLSAP